MVAAYVRALQKYAVFSGRASRSEFWWFLLANLIIVVAASVIAAFFRELVGLSFVPTALSIGLGVYHLAVLLPSYAVTVRRLHDSGKSAWWLLLLLIHVVTALVFIFGFFLLFFAALFGAPPSVPWGLGIVVVLAALVSFIAMLTLLIFMVLPSDSGRSNKYGLKPS